jgi:hypothetical protein
VLESIGVEGLFVGSGKGDVCNVPRRGNGAQKLSLRAEYLDAESSVQPGQFLFRMPEIRFLRLRLPVFLPLIVGSLTDARSSSISEGRLPLDPPAPFDHADYFDCPPETGVCFPDAISYKAHFRRRDSWVRNDLVEENF